MTPQTYPLFATTEDGTVYLVVGWCTTTEADPEVPDMPYTALPVLIAADRRVTQREAATDPSLSMRYSTVDPRKQVAA